MEPEGSLPRLQQPTSSLSWALSVQSTPHILFTEVLFQYYSPIYA